MPSVEELDNTLLQGNIFSLEMGACYLGDLKPFYIVIIRLNFKSILGFNGVLRITY